MEDVDGCEGPLKYRGGKKKKKNIEAVRLGDKKRWERGGSQRWCPGSRLGNLVDGGAIAEIEYREASQGREGGYTEFEILMGNPV